MSRTLEMLRAPVKAVVAKMQCHSNDHLQGKTIASLGDGVDGSPNRYSHPAKITLGAVYEGSKTQAERDASENAIFGNATPWAETVMGIANPQSAEFFKPGKKYYVTFTEAPD